MSDNELPERVQIADCTLKWNLTSEGSVECDMDLHGKSQFQSSADDIRDIIRDSAKKICEILHRDVEYQIEEMLDKCVEELL